MTPLRAGLMAAVLSGLTAAAPALAQDLTAYEQAEQALIAVWDQMPLNFRTATFVSGEAEGYGLFTERETAVFAPNEPIVVYAEPMGYGWQVNDDGTYSFGLVVDIVLRDGAGAVVGSQENFQRYTVTSRAQNREFFITLTLNLTGAPAGDYSVEYIVHDIASDEQATIALPFSIAAQ